ncbi:hypothetical protein [Natronincola ferrireducens]|uniref:Membrane protein implicated in regulation of membrane protease activity n=1 Tax=Natronincola ferrireducens TaxID=393762 RepID=A0A1G9BS45_9FIRM|nr:hypothetical protein [Natronincola ferrireducens]SDK41775.1 Membrane protein implicated in regulation of membrane protease activity [Natronincola ferrireducens]
MFKVFDICFKTGALFAVVSFALGQIFNFMGAGGDIDVDVDLDVDLDFDSDTDSHGSGNTVTPLKPVVITAFITVFGGVGLISLNRGIESFLATIIASASGLIVSTLLYKLVIVPLHKAQNTSAISQKELIGHRAKVKLEIKANVFGSIVYSKGGNTYSAPAKSREGVDIKRGEEVIIIAIEKGVYYVEKI